MYKTTARAVTAVHDLFVFAALLFTVASFFLRGSRPYSEMPTAWVVVFLLWLAFCVWSTWKTLSALIRGGGARTAKFEALMERRAQSASGLWTMTIVTGIVRLAIPAVLWTI
mgnify:CR=1 FL=1